MRAKWLFNLMNKVFSDLRRNLWSLFLYNSIFAFLNFFALSPLLSWAVSFMASSGGRLSVDNAEVLSFMFSPRGVFFVLLVGSLRAVTLYIKHAGMILLAWQSIAGRPMSGLWAFWAVVQRLPRLTLLGSYHVAAHLLLIAPFAILCTLIYRFVFSSMDVYFLFLESAVARWIGLAAALFLVGTIIILHGIVYLHWVFSLPALLVDNLSTAAALTYIHDLLKGKRRQIGAVVFSFWTVIILLPFALAHGFHLLGGRVFARLPEEHGLIIPAVLGLMVSYLAMSFIGEFLTIAVSCLTITRLYAGLRQAQGTKRPGSRASHTSVTRVDREKECAESPLHSDVAKSMRTHVSHRPRPRQIVIFMVMGAVVTLSIVAGILSDFDLHDNVKITAHRGSSASAPENTLAAIRAAIAEGADFVEIDVRLTSDDYAVLLHDKDLFRVAGLKRNLSDLTYDQIKILDVGSWFSSRFRDERIPLFSDVVVFCKGRIKLNIELKVDRAPHKLAERIVQVLREHDAVSESIVSSANIEGLEHIRSLEPSIRTGFILAQSIGEVTALDVDFLSVSSRLTTPGLISAAHAAGKEIHVWTVNKRRRMARFIDLGVDNLITDLPSVALDLLDERAAMSSDELLFIKVRSWFLR